MTQTYSSGEVMYIAMQIEQNGARTYRELAKRFPALAGMYHSLAVDEDQHYMVFADLRDTAGKAGAFHNDEEARSYLNRVAGSFVFEANADPMKAFAAVTTPAGALEVAIGQEQKSIDLYAAMLKAVSGRKEQTLIRRIIDQEQLHIEALAKERDTRIHAG